MTTMSRRDVQPRWSTERDPAKAALEDVRQSFHYELSIATDLLIAAMLQSHEIGGETGSEAMIISERIHALMLSATRIIEGVRQHLDEGYKPKGAPHVSAR